MKAREPRDHGPVLVSLIAQLSLGPLPRRPPRPNREALYQCVQVGFKRNQVPNAMEEEEVSKAQE
eukprot:6601714-Pyramimonas_sp.AAC.1